MSGPLGELAYSCTVQIWRKGARRIVTTHVHAGDPGRFRQQQHEVPDEEAAMKLSAQMLYLAADEMAAPSEAK